MLTNKKEKSTTVKRSLIIFIYCIAVIALTGVNAFAQHYLSHSVRDSLTHKEKIALLAEEYPALSRYELEDRVKNRTQAVFQPEKDYVYGGFRENLSAAEKRRLINEED